MTEIGWFCLAASINAVTNRKCEAATNAFYVSDATVATCLTNSIAMTEYIQANICATRTAACITHIPKILSAKWDNFSTVLAEVVVVWQRTGPTATSSSTFTAWERILCLKHHATLFVTARDKLVRSSTSRIYSFIAFKAYNLSLENPIINRITYEHHLHAYDCHRK